MEQLTLYDFNRPEKITGIDEALAWVDECKLANVAVVDMLMKADSVLNHMGFNNIYVSYSGGADSDIMLDLCEMLAPHKAHYVWFDTGLEYQATKDHLLDMEKKYGVKIERIKAIKPIPQTVKEYGVPFCSKFASEMIERLLRNGFKWQDGSLEEQLTEYPNAKGSVRWWNNVRDITDYGFSQFNISYNLGLKEFMMNNPPDFKISPKCCLYAKKKVAKKLSEQYKPDLQLVGVRKAEGG